MLARKLRMKGGGGNFGEFISSGTLSYSGGEKINYCANSGLFYLLDGSICYYGGGSTIDGISTGRSDPQIGNRMYCPMDYGSEIIAPDSYSPYEIMRYNPSTHSYLGNLANHPSTGSHPRFGACCVGDYIYSVESYSTNIVKTNVLTGAYTSGNPLQNPINVNGASGALYLMDLCNANGSLWALYFYQYDTGCYVAKIDPDTFALLGDYFLTTIPTSSSVGQGLLHKDNQFYAYYTVSTYEIYTGEV